MLDESDGFGHGDWYAVAGVYCVVVANGGIIQQVYPDQSVGNIGSAGVLPSGTVTNLEGPLVAGALIIGNGGADIQTGPVFPGDPTLFLNGEGVFASPAAAGSVSINGVSVASPNFVNSASVTFTVFGSTISLTAAGGGAVTSVFGRTGAVAATSGDYGVAQITGAAPTASPTFTGTATIAGAHITGTLADGTNAVGTSGQVLTSTVTGILWATPSSGALVVLEAHTASNSAELDFTASFSSTYDDYLVEIINIVPASSGANIFFQASTNGGASYDTGSNYGWAGYRASSVGSTAAGSNSTTSIGLDVDATVTNTASAGGLCGSFRISNPLSGTTSTRLKGETGANDGTANFCIVCMFSGEYVPTTAVNAFRIIASAGNLTSGTVRVYGFVK